MKNFKVLLLTILTVFLTVISCGGKDETNKNVLRVGMEAAYAPFNWTQPNDSNGAVKTNLGYANGYDVQIAKLIAEKLGMDLEIVPSDWDSLLGPALNSDKIDLVIAGVSPTEERKNSLDFTSSYYNSDLVIIVNKDSKYASATSLDDLEGAKLTAQLNTLHYDVLEQANKISKQTAMESFPTMLVALKSGKIDGYVSEKPTAIAVTLSDPNLTYVEFEEGKGFEYSHDEVDVAIAVKKGNKELLDKVEKALSEIDKETREKLMEEAIKNQPLSE